MGHVAILHFPEAIGAAFLIRGDDDLQRFSLEQKTIGVPSARMWLKRDNEVAPP